MLNLNMQNTSLKAVWIYRLSNTLALPWVSIRQTHVNISLMQLITVNLNIQHMQFYTRRVPVFWQDVFDDNHKLQMFFLHMGTQV
jgi:hypothetical protein